MQLFQRRALDRIGFLVALLLLLLVALSAPSSAQADRMICPEPGVGAGECAPSPQGVAVDFETGRTYVADRGNNRVMVFDSEGDFLFGFGYGVADGTTAALQTCTTTCFKGIAGTAAGQLSAPRSIAVDNDPGSGAFHDVYVGSNNAKIKRFSPSGSFELEFGTEGTGVCEFSRSSNWFATGPGGTIYVAESSPLGPSESEGFLSKIERFSPAGACIDEKVIFAGGNQRLRQIAVDSTGDVYLPIEGLGGELRKYDLAGPTFLYSLTPESQTNGLAVDEDDSVIAAQRSQQFGVISEYDSSGNLLKRWGYDRIPFLMEALARAQGVEVGVVGSLSDGVPNATAFLNLPTPGPITAPSTVAIDSVGSARATLKARINPEGKATTFSFQYIDQQSYEAEGGFAGPNLKEMPPTPLGGADDFLLHDVSALIGCAEPISEGPEGKCLDPETTYRFRVIATNDDGAGEGTAVGPALTTKPPLATEAWALSVATDSALLRAAVNPFGVQATGHFQYVDEATYQQSGFAEAQRAPIAEELDFGAGEEPAIRTAPLTGLEPGTRYRYRLLADNPIVEPIAGPTQTFRTFAVPQPRPCPANAAFRIGPSALLPDCRAYEIVSPLDKEGGDIIPLREATTSEPAVLEQASLDGEALVFGSYRSFGEADSAPFTSQYLARRDAEGWVTHGISAPRGRLVTNPGITLDTELKALSPDLCSSWFRSLAEPQLAPEAVPGYSNLYRRTDQSCGPLAYQALTRIEPPHRAPEELNSLELQGLSADGSRSIYVIGDNLPGTGAPLPALGSGEFAHQLYYFDGSKTSFVCVLPNGSPSTDLCQAGGPAGFSVSRKAMVEDAISADGSRVFWTSYPSTPGPGRIYLRLNPGEPQSPSSGGKCTKPERGCTIAISAKAEELSSTTESQYWGASESGDRAFFTTIQLSGAISDLYEARIESDRTVATRLIAQQSPGVLGVSDDGTEIYFASRQVLSGPNAEGRSPLAGRPNLYLDSDGTTRFLMELTEADVSNTDTNVSAINRIPYKRVSRVSPSGAHAIWMSAASPTPTGYDNTDAKSGKAAAEVYRYDAEAAGGAGRLLCVSCNPTGGRPVGENIEPKGAYWAAAEIPAWENTLYAPRALSDDGSRVFFETREALVIRDSNGVKDVYQWEREGAGDCTSSDAAYSPAAQGCIDLISSGKSLRGSILADATPSGEDVFFATLSSLVPHDYGLVDIYDARAGGGLPVPPSPPVECESEACQSPTAPPEPTPLASLAYRGPADLKPAARKKRRCAKGKRRVKRKGRVRCVRRKRMGRKKVRRANRKHHRVSASRGFRR